jgi:ornithine cyclodeaminase/alanine dehydrogenase
MLWLPASDVERCGPPPAECIEICARALDDKASGNAELPPKLGVSPRAGAVLHAMPARVRDVVGMKWISIVPGRRPAIAGVIVLNDAQSGEPEAILDAEWITAARTGACAALAARKLARSDAKVLGILGPGVQARAAVLAVRAALPGVREVRAYAPRRLTAERFGAETGAVAVGTAEEALRGAGVAITAAPWPTPAPPPIVPEWIAAGALVCALDYDASVSPACAASFDRRFADDVGQMRLARAKGSFAAWPDDFSELHAAARQHPDEKLLCANLGLAILDVAVARAVLDRARSSGAGQKLR